MKMEHVKFQDFVWMMKHIHSTPTIALIRARMNGTRIHVITHPTEHENIINEVHNNLEMRCMRFSTHTSSMDEWMGDDK